MTSKILFRPIAIRTFKASAFVSGRASGIVLGLFPRIVLGWACGLVSVVACALVSAVALGVVFTPVFAQAERAYSIPGNRVLSIDEDRDQRSLVIRTENSTVAGRPIFKYLPGADGDTILTADFVGLAWNSPAKIIRLNSSEKGFRSGDPAGIKEVRVGQFVDSPAVLRISFVAHDARLLKRIAIAAGPGMLKVSWGAKTVVPAKVVNNVASALPLVAPAIVARQVGVKQADPERQAEKSLEDGENRQAFRSRSPTNASASGADNGPGAGTARSGAIEDRVDKADRVDGADRVDKADRADRVDKADKVEESEPPIISLVPCDNMGSGATVEIFRVEMPQGCELSFRTFRLHEPERYVIDIPNCPSLASATLPDLTNSALVSSMRVGVPSESEGVGRLVLQLTDSQVNVADNFTPGSNFLSITLGKGLMLGSEGGQTSEKFSSGAIAPGPIFVPRAPSETVVVLDAGHGGSDPGAMRSDIQEKDITLGIIEKLKKILEAKGARIVLTRHDDTFVSLEDRVKITNQVGPNLFLSVHVNSLETTSNIYGIETYFQTEHSRPLAERVHASLVAGLGAPDRNIRRARFYVINHTPVPAILAEVGYITNKAERDRLISSDYQQKVASALARGVMLYLQDAGVASGQLANSARGQNAHNPQ